MIENFLTVSVLLLFTCSIASIVSGVAWMRYEEERQYLDAVWNDGITREPKEND